MKNLFGSLVDRLKRKEDNLTFIENLVDKSWQQIDNSKNVFRQLEFQRNGVLLDTIQGNVSRKTWELTGSGKISIIYEGKEKLFYATFIENFQLSLSPSGSINSAEIFWEEKHLVNSVKEFLQKETENKIQEEKRRIEEENRRMDELAYKSGFLSRDVFKWSLEMEKPIHEFKRIMDSSNVLIGEIIKEPLTPEKLKEKWRQFEMARKAFKKMDSEKLTNSSYNSSESFDNFFSNEAFAKTFIKTVKDIDQALLNLEKMQPLLLQHEYREKRAALKFSKASLIDFLNLLKNEKKIDVPDLE